MSDGNIYCTSECSCLEKVVGSWLQICEIVDVGSFVYGGWLEMALGLGAPKLGVDTISASDVELYHDDNGHRLQ